MNELIKEEEEKTKTKDEKKKMAKQYKVGITEKGIQELNRFIGRMNHISKKKVRTPEVLEHAVSKLTDSDMVVIRERVYTVSDKFEILLEQVNSQESETKLSKEALLSRLMENYLGTGKGKQIKLSKNCSKME